LDASFAASRWTAVVGPNGAGKSTLLKALAGLLPHKDLQGRVMLHGEDVSQLGSRARAQRMAWLGQSEGGAQDLCVYDVAMLGRLPHQAWLAPASVQDHQAVEQALRSTQAWEWRERPLSHLSSGERQRVLLARLLAVQAQVLLMDEPLANLDPPHQTDVLQIMRGLAARGTTVISVLHEISAALQADDVLVMQQGSVLHHGACSDAASHRAIERVFDERIDIQSVRGMQVVLPRLEKF
jgi:iron complex transport system ATP-binding protein